MGNKNYVYWPVTIDGYKEPLHITAKFLGNLDLQVSEIREIVKWKFTKTFKSHEFAWEPVIFNASTRVLELTDFPQEMVDVKKALDFLRKDDYPGFRPHITIPYGLWSVIRSKNGTPESMNLRVGRLKFKTKGLIIDL